MPEIRGKEIMPESIVKEPESLEETADQLLVRIRRQDGGALEQLIHRYSGRVSRLAFRLTGWEADVDDLVQDVFVAIWEKAHQFRGASRAETWIDRITINRCRNWRRGRRVMNRFYQRLRPDPNQVDRVHEVLADREVIHRALQQLRHRDREIIALHYLEGRELSEVASLLDLTTNAVTVRLHRARARLGNILRREAGDKE